MEVLEILAIVNDIAVNDVFCQYNTWKKEYETNEFHEELKRLKGCGDYGKDNR